MGELIIGRPALIVIDVQQAGFLPPAESGIPHMPGFASRVERIVTLVAACRDKGSRSCSSRRSIVGTSWTSAGSSM